MVEDLRLLEHREMTRVRYNLKPAFRNTLCENNGFSGWRDDVLSADHDQRGDADIVKIGPAVRRIE
ncbi:hypothetical protein HFO42_22720 [Rhizobium leguminosarum]|uniref:Uncharacterized protein n=1 Tax=Rhizobium leguminosarum TaxID=384 RepID=A0AAJ1EGF7_RHILE|nr:hypothetical protein [Rhizobium leguminosarum]MBY5594867.1 hypothetical protein [Rhizobium leguminosarum]MBY5609308.1 hypothetical protein [Rhizobium leguminosarum]MBY5618897.1 hypothetical protein [Rhizobium leguminosarum]MBY5630892.1 hypothetical protein [Rhizobium leguminosarum]